VGDNGWRLQAKINFPGTVDYVHGQWGLLGQLKWVAKDPQSQLPKLFFTS